MSFTTKRSQDQKLGPKNPITNPKDNKKVIVKVCSFCKKIHIGQDNATR